MAELPTEFQKFVHLSKYSRWLEDKERRENTWDETVTRYMDFFEEQLDKKFNYKMGSLRSEIYEAITNLEVVPSMRGIMTAGPALERCNVCLYNCSALPINHPRCFDELMYILMSGTGVGFSVERQFINQLPCINEHFEKSSTTIVVADSKAGWSRAFRELIAMLYAGQIPDIDYSRLRPAGARLKTFGGRSSGPEPLKELFEFTIRIFRNAAGRKLNSIECHDICCKTGEVVVSGGSRRSALLSLSNLSDDRMRVAKSGQWWVDNPQRALANNSYALTERPEMGVFMNEWKALYESKSGERGIFSRYGADEQARRTGRRETGHDWLVNPCAEIILRPFGFCNLTEVVVRENDTKESLQEKTRLATILGTWQSGFTDFKYLRKIWKKNAEEERLLGVSLTGIMDCDLTSIRADKEELSSMLREFKSYYIDVNKQVAEQMGIEQSAAIGTLKPSGSVSSLVNSAPGISSRFRKKFYIRTARGSNVDPLTQFLIDQGVPNEPCVMNPTRTTVFSFPIEVPENSVTQEEVSAVEMLEHWLIYKNNWTEHSVSVTVNVREHEWLEAGAWVYKHIDEITGVSFLPYSDHTYKQAPYQECTKEEFDELVARMPKIDWSKLVEYEKEDATTSSQELSCTAGACDIIDFGSQN